MQKITPHLWYDKEAKEAAEFYVSAFGGDSKVKGVQTLHDTPSGDTDVVSFELLGKSFMAISAGPYFKFTPVISFIVNFDPSRDKEADKNIDVVWKKLSQGGTVLMDIGEYPFSKRYGWIQDKYGLTWQLMLTNPEGEERPYIVPMFLFVRERAGKAEEATNFWTSVFKDSKKGTLMRHPAGNPTEKEGTVLFTDFKLLDTWFAAMDSANPGHNFDFNEAVSFIVKCEDQAEIDYYWEKLSAVPASEQCGWLKDKYGVSWQIVPAAMDRMMQSGTKEQIDQVTQTFLKMKKLDIAELEKAYAGA
ncbi:VOC family protein [Candidatus Kaiserbacteria bacterium]|nr:VOC family protein [Candidatus Kaiserbacteria bacterium]